MAPEPLLKLQNLSKRFPGGVVGLVLRMRNLVGADLVSDTVPSPEAPAASAPQP